MLMMLASCRRSTSTSDAPTQAVHTQDAPARIERDVLVDVMTDATADVVPRWQPPVVQCMGHRLDEDIARETRPCLPRTVERIRQWKPDAMVVLGGGMLSNGEGNCATIQRGYLAGQMAEAFENVQLILSGNGHSAHAVEITPWMARCIQTRIQRAPDETTNTPTEAQHVRALRDASAIVAGQRRTLTEAEAMCAVMIERTQPDRREGVLARVHFEDRSWSTDQNARFTRPMIVRGGYERVLVLTSPVLKRFGRGIDPHADRALEGFQSVRGRGTWALAAVGCPLHGGLSTYYKFEAVPWMPEGMSSVVAR
jgi:hypothetical protein